MNEACDSSLQEAATPQVFAIRAWPGGPLPASPAGRSDALDEADEIGSLPDRADGGSAADAALAGNDSLKVGYLVG